MERNIIFLVVLMYAICIGKANSQETNTNKYAFEQNERLGRGVNIIGYDPIWRDHENARMKERHFKLIKEAGFDNVRIPVMPFKFITNERDYKLDPQFFKTLDWVVEQALDNELMPIIDLHEHHAMQEDPIANRELFLAIWKQIAEHYKDYPKELLFEIANEPNMKPEIWNEIHSAAHKIIRESNPDRTIIIGTIYGNQIQYLKDLELPENDRNIIVAIHYYSPIQFTHQGAPWSTKNKNLSGITWTNKESEESAVKADFDIAQEWSKAHNRPITLGEFGAYEKADMASRVNWTNFIVREAESRNWSWGYWQFDSDFILYDIDKEEWVSEIKNALIPAKKIMTINGSINSGEMGWTLTHEHIMSNFGATPEMAGNYDEIAAFKQIIPYLRGLKQLGIKTIFDGTTAYFGRRVDLLKIISDSTDIKIVTNTGYYGAANDRYIPPHAFVETAEQLSGRWANEFETGIDGTNIKPGFIKLAFDSDTVSDIDLKLFEAGVLTHKQTGLTLAVHTGDNPKALRAALDLLDKHDVSPSAFVWIHANKSNNSDLMMELALKGAWISLDGANYSNTDEYINLLQKFKDNNLLYKVLLSHDGNSFPHGNEIRPYDAIPTVLVPALKNNGFSDGDISLLLYKNPQDAFSISVKENPFSTLTK